MLARSHLKSQNSDGPNISVSSAILSLSVLGRQVLHGAVNLLLALLLASPVSQAEVDKLDGPLDKER